MPVGIALAWLTSADAAEVVWLAPADTEITAAIAEQAGASRAPVTAIELRTASTDFGPKDEEAYRRLGDTLRDVRKYETQLDGELLIMDELSGPIAAIGLVRNETDRAALFSALAYQGFAVERFFAEGLGTDDRAAKYRSDMEGLVVALPWADAVALDPARQVTPYDIAEAPQRVRYGQIQQQVAKSLAARIAAADLPEGSRILADGRAVELGPGGTATLVPGRHLVHVEKDGHILARWDLRLASAERRELALPLPDSEWQAFVAAIQAGTLEGGGPAAVPAGLVPAIQALGGEVWLVDPAQSPKAGEYVVWKVGADAVTPAKVELARDEMGAPAGPWSVLGSVGGGWFSSGDFYTQDPANTPRTIGGVNAISVVFDGEIDRDFGFVRVGAGVETAVTIGQHHVAFYGEHKTPVRPYVYVAGGVKPLQATLGYVFPHHPALGLHGGVPIAGPLEIAGSFWYGIKPTKTYADGTIWEDGLPIFAGTVAVGYRPHL